MTLRSTGCNVYIFTSHLSLLLLKEVIEGKVFKEEKNFQNASFFLKLERTQKICETNLQKQNLTF